MLQFSCRLVVFFQSLKFLTSLSLRANKLTVLPDSLCHPGSLLSYLDVSENALATLPNALSRLARLATLNVRRNRLTRLPFFIGRMATLDDLDASHNLLANLPGGLKNLKLSRLDISANPMATRENLPASPVLYTGPTFPPLSDLAALAFLKTGNPVPAPSELPRCLGDFLRTGMRCCKCNRVVLSCRRVVLREQVRVAELARSVSVDFAGTDKVVLMEELFCSDRDCGEGRR